MATTNPNIKALATSINNFVKKFLSNDNLTVESWSSPSNQKQLRSVLSGKELKKPKEDKSEKPKKSKSSYLYFCAEDRQKIKQEQPDLTSVNVTVLLGKRWKELKEDKTRVVELLKYEKMASSDNERYVNEKQSVKKKTTDKPKKAKSAYLLFCEQMRPVVKVDHPNMKAKEIIVELGRRWQLQKAQ